MPKANKNLMIIGAIILVIITIVLMKNPRVEEYSGSGCKVNDEDNKYYGKYDISGCLTKTNKSSCIGMTNRNIGDRAVKPCGWNCDKCFSTYKGNDFFSRSRRRSCLEQNNCYGFKPSDDWLARFG
jgi:hypothetical protein